MPSLPAGVLVVLTSAAVLVLEVLSIRLVAPYVGLTLETYTAAIGVALGAIALGAYAGGRAADAFDPRSYLGPLITLGGAVFFAARPIVLAVGPQVGSGTSAAVVLVLLAVALPVTLLSAVPPSVVKLRLTGLDETGSVVGRLSALGTAGALVGTFLTGFVLLATLPTSYVLVAVGTVLVVVGVVTTLWLRRTATVDRLRMTAGPLVLALLTGVTCLAADGPCEYESAYYCARVEADPGRSGRESGRLLYLDDLRHSYVDLDDPAYLEFAYSQRIGDALSTLPPGPLSALHIGGGGFSVPRHLRAVRPGSQSLVLELDPTVLEVGRDQLGLVTGPDLQVRLGDARQSLAALPDEAYDVVVGDAFGSLSVPWHLATEELVREVQRVLRPGGLYVLNVIDNPPLNFVAAETATLDAVFDEVLVMARTAQLRGAAGGNFVLVAGDGGLPDRARLLDLAAQRGEPGGVSDASQLDQIVGDAAVLTDDNAPVEQLLTPRPSA